MLSKTDSRKYKYCQNRVFGVYNVYLGIYTPMYLLMSNKSYVKHHIVSAAAVTGVLGGSPTASAAL